MAKVHNEITEELQTFIERQPLFFVATSPLSETGHINLSPKGLDAFRVLSHNTVAYLDLTGSGNETSAHLHENRRITFMFCAFQGPPNIVRLFGQGRVVFPGTPEWDTLSPRFTLYPGARQIVVAEITRVQTSCGYSVPFMDFVGERDTLTRWAEKKGEEALAEYRHEKNTTSIDGLPIPVGASSEVCG